MAFPFATAALRGPDTGPVRVFIVDGHELARRSLRDLLEGEGLEVVGECWTAAEASRRILAAGTDVVVLSGLLPDGTGLEVFREARSLDVNLRCLIMTSYVDEAVLRGVVLAGAAGYVLRQIRGHHLVAAIRAAARGEMLLRHDVMARSRELLANATAEQGFNDLTGGERAVLALMAADLTNRQINEALSLPESRAHELISTLLVKLGYGGRGQLPSGR